jgi:uncharacterized protein (DUF433 family)
VAQASKRSAASREAFVQAIADAKAAGETHEDIAAAAGLTRQRIAQILKALASALDDKD